MKIPAMTFKVGLVQMAMSADPDANLQTAVAKVAEAASAGAQLVCLPELFRSRYFAQREEAASFDLAEPLPGPSTEALARAAQRAGVVVIAPVFERRAPGLYHNSAAVIDADGRLVGIYRKMHIPDDPAYYEKFYFAPGDLGFRAFDTRVGRIGTLVCWDQWYPEGARLTALQGAAVLFYPTAIGWHPKEKATHGAEQLDAWRTIQRSHAIANGCYVAAVNRVGHERPSDGNGDGIEFWGSSFLADPFGAVIAEAPRDREAIVVAEVVLDRIEEVRRGWPFLRDRRIDAYAGIASRFLDNAPSAVGNAPSAISRQPSAVDGSWRTADSRRRISDSRRRIIEEAAGDPGIRVDAPITQERPSAAHLLDAVEVDLRDHDRLAVSRGFRHHRPERICQERRAPELDAVPIPVARAFMSDAVHGVYGNALRS